MSDKATKLWDALLERDDTAVPALNAALDGYPELLKALEEVKADKCYCYYHHDDDAYECPHEVADKALATERARLEEAHRER